MAKIKDLLTGQKLTFDNHHPNVPATWDMNLHFHKSMTVVDKNGNKQRVSGVIYVAADRDVEIQWDLGNNNHKNIQDKKTRDALRNKLKKEIKGALSDQNQSKVFFDNVDKHLKSINSGTDKKVIESRINEAHKLIMSSLGINTSIQFQILNKDTTKMPFFLYADTSEKTPNIIEFVSKRIKLYNRSSNYHMEPLRQDFMLYFICSDDGKLCIGEMTPSISYEYRMKGYPISAKAIEEDNKE